HTTGHKTSFHYLHVGDLVVLVDRTHISPARPRFVTDRAVSGVACSGDSCTHLAFCQAIQCGGYASCFEQSHQHSFICYLIITFSTMFSAIFTAVRWRLTMTVWAKPTQVLADIVA